MKPYRPQALLTLLIAPAGAQSSPLQEAESNRPFISVVAQSDSTDSSEQPGAPLAAPLLSPVGPEHDTPVRTVPLVRVVDDARIPTVLVDRSTAGDQVDASAHEKANAIDLYADLLRRGDKLITLGVRSPKVDTHLQAPPDQAWLSIPITFNADDEAIRDWKTKFELVATQRARLQIPIIRAHLNGPDQDRSCNVPIFDTSFALKNGVSEQTFTGTITPDGEHGVVACFATEVGPDERDSRVSWTALSQ